MANLTYVVPTEQQIEISLASELPPVFGNWTDTLLSLSIFDTKSHLTVDVTICLENMLQQLTCISDISKMAKHLGIEVKMGRTSLGLTIHQEIKALINTPNWDLKRKALGFQK